MLAPDHITLYKLPPPTYHHWAAPTLKTVVDHLGSIFRFQLTACSCALTDICANRFTLNAVCLRCLHFH